MIHLETSLSNLPRIQPKYLKKLKKLGLETVRDLIFYFPFRYDDYSQILPINQLEPGQIVTISGTVEDIKSIRTWRKRMLLTEAVVSDETGSIKVFWFNQSFITNSLTIGKKVRISGKADLEKGHLAFSNPAWELASRTPTNTGRLVPVYSVTAGITPKFLRWQIQMLLERNLDIPDPVPDNFLKDLHLPSIKPALKEIHFPTSKEEALRAQKRFSFENMLLIQLKSLQVRISWQKEKSDKIKFDEKLIKKFVSKLPFKLTGAQRKSAFQILKDLEKERPMNRLLNGDVGAGKTIVAAIGALQAIDKNYQVAIMAPTEVLAHQHFESFCKLFEDYNFNIALLTNSYKLITKNQETKKPNNLETKSSTRQSIIKKIKSGEINLMIGTHSLIQKDIDFKKLALIVIDEQHRFGVEQRAYLQQKSEEINTGRKNKTPHFLSMTATPIPRTLTLAFFGNLDISVLDEMPKNRKPIITKIIEPLKRENTYAFIKSEVKKGRQIFVIFPLVEESEKMTEVKAAKEEHENLAKNIFPDFSVGLLHGKMKAKEKEETMEKFKARKYDILAATSVVEVGIDVPNATVMLIENADRFGLSQLHQFRGRVGREKHQSYCFLFTQGKDNQERDITYKASSRLKALEKTNSGFEIAEYDLEIRGPGEFFGTRQSGMADNMIKDIANVKLVEISREYAKKIILSNPSLSQYPLLSQALDRFNQKIHLE